MVLYRIELEKQKTQKSGVADLPDGTEVTETDKIVTELPEVSPLGIPLEEVPETHNELPSGDTSDDFGALQNKVFRMEVQLNARALSFQSL